MFYWISNVYNHNSPKGLKPFGDFFLIGKLNFSVVAVVLMGITSCTGKREKQTTIYNLDSLVQEQIHLLADKKASSKKTVRLGEKESATELTPEDTLMWKKELDIFTELSVLNKPINRKEYVVEDGLTDTKSNLTIKSISTNEEGLPVKYLRIYYLPEPYQLKKIEGYTREENMLYQSARFFTLEFEELHNQPTLTSYTVNGGQKMFLRDSVTFSVHATLSIP